MGLGSWGKSATGLSVVVVAVTTSAVLALAGCSSGGSGVSSAPVTPPVTTPTSTIPQMAPTFSLTGDTSMVHDPSLTYAGGAYYSMSTDPEGQTAFLPIRISTDKIHWTRTGQIFNAIPDFVQAYFAPNKLTTLWAPDVSYFNGLYHVYYAASMFGTNTSFIGLVTSPTMDPTDPGYGWTSQGIVFGSHTGDIFNAIDPSVLVDTDAGGNLSHVWLTYGSYFGGIFQREIDPATGLLSTTNTAAISIATRPGVQFNPIEGTSLVKHNGYYYLFASFDFCCNANPATDNYKIAVGRSTSAQGPFVDEAGTPMLQGGGTIILESGSQWIAPGGATVLIDPVHGDLIAYHALSVAANYQTYLFVDGITWPNDWPVITQ